MAEQTREALLLLPEISRVDLTGGKEYQIDIEIPEGALRSYGVSLQQLAEVVRRENVEMPGGTIRAKSQEVLLRGHNRRLTGREIAELPLITHPDGAVLTIGDVGTVRDAFADRTAISELDGLPVLVLSVQRDSTEDLFRIVDAVKSFAAEHPTPAGYEVVTWADRSTEVRGRVELLLSNGLQGLVIVFVLLAVFLELRLAFWIALGIPFSLLVSGAFMYFTGQTLNMISMFAFIMALGIVVDDAIVVGENIFAHRQMGKSLARAAMDGAFEVAPSVLASVSTTMIAFAPLLFVSGMMGKVVMVLPTVVIAMLFVSLVESITHPALSPVPPRQPGLSGVSYILLRLRLDGERGTRREPVGQRRFADVHSNGLSPVAETGAQPTDDLPCRLPFFARAGVAPWFAAAQFPWCSSRNWTAIRWSLR